MQGPAPQNPLFSIDVVFREKSNEKWTCFVAGEEVNGTAYLKVAKPQPFASIHLEVVGKLTLKHRHDPGPETKKKLPVTETLLEKVLARGTGFTYASKSGDDKVRTLSIPFSFVMPDDLLPSFVWKSAENKPDSQRGGELSYEFFAWMDLKGGKDRTGGVLPDPAVCSKRLPISVVPHSVSNVAGGPKSRNNPQLPNVRSDSTVEHSKGLQMTLKLSESTFVMPAMAHTVVSIDNRTSKTVDGVIFGVDEIVTVKFGSKPVEYRTNVLLDRPNAPVFVDKKSSGVVKHSVSLTPPRGTDSGIANCSVDTPYICIRHELTCAAMCKGIKEKDVTCSVPLTVWTQLQERHEKEFHL